MERADRRDERGVEVADLQAAVVRRETPRFGEGSQRLVEPPGAQEGEPEQPVRGREIRTRRDRRGELADRGREVACREAGAAEEEPTRRGAGPAAHERGERADGPGVLAEGVTAAAEIEQGEGELVRGPGDAGEELRGTAVVAAASCLEGLRVEGRVIGGVR